MRAAGRRAPEPVVAPVEILRITQATRATFADLFIRMGFLCFIHRGEKRVVCPRKGEMIGREGDLMIFPPGSIVTLENRPLLNGQYEADGVYFSSELIEAVFADQPAGGGPEVQILTAVAHRPEAVLALIRQTLEDAALPPPIRAHRLVEPLIWLRHHGIRLRPLPADEPLARLRGLIETDLSHPWRAAEVARHFAMSEASLRRWLGRSGHGFQQILQTTRLEKGLTLLQTTRLPISEIALDCGFKTPSHFSDSFRQRFGIKPKAIRTAAD
ncbi:AraC family transcriptional regulator [Rhizobium rhizosphaerae]|uniref:AraC family transcriptional regulator n=1 Tax=Xaviernesmea rhizosphaerae TaxID=1672749 RepID=A0A1Q9ANK8_9HYPH|nr:AraC family transcriptional regulator [Xaviernesmea rhizosphaerae]